MNEKFRDVVIPWKNNTSGEIDFAVKSLSNIKSWDNYWVYVISDARTYRGPHAVDVALPNAWKTIQSPSRFADVENKIYYALMNFVETDEFILSNDDFFVMKPIEDIPVAHRGTIREVMQKRLRHDSYWRALQDTLEYLTSHGIPEPLCYELHIPMVMNTKRRIFYSEDCAAYFRNGKQLLMRSIYGNLEQIGGERMEDIKNITDFRGQTFLSTTEQTFQMEIGKYIKENL